MLKNKICKLNKAMLEQFKLFCIVKQTRIIPLWTYVLGQYDAKMYPLLSSFEAISFKYI